MLSSLCDPPPLRRRLPSAPAAPLRLAPCQVIVRGDKRGGQTALDGAPPRPQPRAEGDYMTIDLGLLSARRFLPLFLTQFLGAFNDNLLKSGFVVMLAFGSAVSGPSRELAGQLAGAALIVPYLFVSALAGQISDRFDRSLVARVVKACEVPLIVIAAIAMIIGNGWLVFAMLCTIGVQTTFLGPVKYALLPQHLREEELVAGNGLIESSTFIAVLLGSIIGGLTVTLPGGPTILGAL